VNLGECHGIEAYEEKGGELVETEQYKKIKNDPRHLPGLEKYPLVKSSLDYTGNIN
jgi:hypothetical protein